MIKILTLSVAALTLTNIALADSFNEKCPDIQSCAKYTGDLLGQKYIYDPADLKGKIQATGNLDITKDNAEWVFTNMLYMLNYTRVPAGPANTYQIQRQRDAKDSAIPLFEASAKLVPELPHNWDYSTLRYKTSTPDITDDISRMLRNFMPPNTRIISADSTGTLLVTDSNPNLKKLYDMIVDLDKKPTASTLKKWAQERKQREQQSQQKKN